MHQIKRYEGWAVIRYDAAVDAWVAVCPHFAVASHGDSPNEAAEEIRKTVTWTILSDLNNELDPEDRAQYADKEDWDLLNFVLENGKQVDLRQLDDKERKIALHLPLTFAQVNRATPPEQIETPAPKPLAA